MASRRFPETPVFYRDLNKSFPTAVRGEGIYLYDSSGKRYIDASGGALVVSLGHGRRELARAMAEQAESVAYVHGTQFTTDALEDWAERLTRRLPPELSKLYLVPGGSEATETAIKMSRQYHIASGRESKYRAIACRPSYHGGTLGALSVTGREGLRKPYLPLLSSEHHAPAPYCYRCPLGQTYPECGIACADALEDLITNLGPDTVSAFFFEPVGGASTGASVPPPEYLPRVREICDRLGVLLVLDEVLVGYGRTGTFLAHEPSGVVPDLLLLGKGITSGAIPGGAVAVKESIARTLQEKLGAFTHGFTFSHHPVVAAVAREVLRILEDEDLIDRVAGLEATFFDALRKLERFDFVGDIRGRGLLAGIELVRDRKTKEPFPRSRKLAEEVARRAFEKGLIIYYGTGMANGVDGDTLVLGPPFVVEEHEIQQIEALLEETFSELH
ncbi:MAG: aspartate aminotransferase family protein [Vicinamibacteria bacterium]